MMLQKLKNKKVHNSFKKLDMMFLKEMGNVKPLVLEPEQVHQIHHERVFQQFYHFVAKERL